MHKYFVISDMHGFYTPMIKALKEKGYDQHNENHTLIVLGDVFDRGKENYKIYKFLSSIDPKRIVLITGNHEDLYKILLANSSPRAHDFHNCTVDTFIEIAKKEDKSIRKSAENIKRFLDPNDIFFLLGSYKKQVNESLDYWQKKILPAVEKSEATKWLCNKDIWKDYYEVGPYVFVHASVPLTHKSDWRLEKDWHDARWCCPFEDYYNGCFKKDAKKGKILVCGHWHTSAFFEFYNKEMNNPNDTIFRGPDYNEGINLIGIDGGVTYDYETATFNHKQNVLVIVEKKGVFQEEK